MRKLALHPDVKNIKVIWQCSWASEKKSNIKVKHFMANIYKNPPTYRLDARCAGNFPNKIGLLQYFTDQNIILQCGVVLLNAIDLFGSQIYSRMKIFISLTRMDSMDTSP